MANVEVDLFSLIYVSIEVSVEDYENDGEDMLGEVDQKEVSETQESGSAAADQLQLQPNKSAKEKKPKMAKNMVYHPPYFQMIKEALLSLNEKSGSSALAIAMYIEDEYKGLLPPKFREILGLKLYNSAAMGKLNMIQATYKLSESGKNEKGTTKPGAQKSDANYKVKTKK